MNLPNQAQGQFQAPEEKIVLKAGTVIKVGGFPFALVNDTEVKGRSQNLFAGFGPAVGELTQR